MLSWFGIKSNDENVEDPKSTTDTTAVPPSNEAVLTETGKTSSEEIKDECVPSPSTEPEPKPSKAASSMDAMGAAVGFFRTIASAAGKTAHKLKETVDVQLDKTIIGDLERENEKFIREKHAKRTEDPVPPWVGYNEEEEIKSQILSLSADERHFLRDPPSGVDFHFELDAVMPVALTILKEDKQLQAMRFKLVPQKIKEEKFWRNYFYRVSLIKQSSQLSTLANTELKRSTSSLNQDGKRNSKSDLENSSADASHEDTSKTKNKPEGDLSSRDENSKVGDLAKQDSQISDDWEKELHDELQEFEFVSEDQSGEHESNPEWEKEIENMLGLDEEDDNEKKSS